MQSNRLIVSIVLIINHLAQAQGQIGGQAPMGGQPQVGFTQPGQPTTAQQWPNAASNPQASWSRPAAAQPAWPQGAVPQNQFPAAGQPQTGFNQPTQNQPNTPQRWPNAGAQIPQGSVAPGNGADQGMPIDNVGDLNANGVMSGTVPFNTTDTSKTTPNATESPKPSGSASYKLWPSAIGILAILSLF
jgi:hypothetical protein